MTITQDSSAPLVVVVGATGRQGGSVVNALSESDKAYRIRALTRDASKPAATALAERGIAIFAVTIVVENKEKVFEAFEGGDYAFLVTDFFAHMDVNRETAEGKLLVDAAKAGGAKGIVWSGLPNATKLSGGKYTHVYQFDGKARVTEYGLTCGVPFVDVQGGSYADNFLRPPAAPTKQADGSFAIMWPVKPETLVPIVDIVADYGMFVQQVLEMPVFPDGQEFLAYGENIPIADVATQLGQGACRALRGNLSLTEGIL
ncbi:NAD(P)-binding protein [Roridomyces roridus]|uniref:NAD(P)-binding protein n=1 Tax=Roridomyces roridus TaxID=1738132 RepID=A0AAD7BD42_9AGAR|nr:NAD(P)-binding protein [Roridomyces roridus]